jgi:hypothetical protein
MQPVDRAWGSMFRWSLFVGGVAALGWGLRGSIGGGPLGAMIPGALAGMAVGLLLRWPGMPVATVAALGAAGVGMGGMMTYGQIVGFVIKPETFAWGLLGLTVKGAVWGLCGGAFISVALMRGAIPRGDAAAALALFGGGAWAGWKLVNERKVIYFSDPVNQPLPEIWAGLVCGAVPMLAWLTWRGAGAVPVRFALTTMAGGGIGFGLGGAIMAYGSTLPASHNWIPWWRIMEITFGFLSGASMGVAAYRLRPLLRPEIVPSTQRKPSLPVSLLLAALLCTVIVGEEYLLAWRYDFAFGGIILALVALLSKEAAWQGAITVTFCAFSADLLEAWAGRYRPSSLIPGVILVAAAALAVGFLIYRMRRSAAYFLPRAFLLLMWMAVADSIVKPFVEKGMNRGHLLVEIMFIGLAIAATIPVLRGGGLGARV